MLVATRMRHGINQKPATLQRTVWKKAHDSPKLVSKGCTEKEGQMVWRWCFNRGHTRSHISNLSDDEKQPEAPRKHLEVGFGLKKMLGSKGSTKTWESPSSTPVPQSTIMFVDRRTVVKLLALHPCIFFHRWHWPWNIFIVAALFFVTSSSLVEQKHHGSHMCASKRPANEWLRFL